MTTLELAVADCWRWLSDPRSSFDGGSWFVRARSLAPLGIICLGSEEGSMQDARFESGLDVSAPSVSCRLPLLRHSSECLRSVPVNTKQNSPMYDAGSCDKSKGASGMCGGWNCSSSGACGDFKDGKMQLYDVGMASMHTMDSLALAQLARAIGRTTAAATLQQRAEKMTALIEANLWDEASGIYVNKVVSAAKN